MENENKKLGSEPAFQTEVNHENGEIMGVLQTGNTTALYPGMSKRFYAACAAMQGMLSNMEYQIRSAKVAETHRKKADEWLVHTAYSLADELLKQENKPL